VCEMGLVKIPAAWLLDQAGWRGKRKGGAGVHEQHALVIVNAQDATGEDIVLLAQEMAGSVLKRFGIALESEVRLV
jgi:UDP-N-acetylmuramate dehydrogenase